MNAQPHHPGTDLLTAARTAGARLGRLAAVLAAITASLLVTAAGVPAAFARPVPPPGGSYGTAAGPVPATTIIHVITTGGMAAWQITLIALAAALAAATTAVFVDRARASRPMQNVSAPAPASAYDNPGLSRSDQIQFL